MPETTKEADRRAALDAMAASFDVRVPLTDRQADWLDTMLPFLAPLPARMHGGIVRYVLCGLRPGAFLFSLYAGNLFGVLECGDDQNLGLLTSYWLLLMSATPPACFGSRDKVAAWMAIGGVAGAHPTVTGAVAP